MPCASRRSTRCLQPAGEAAVLAAPEQAVVHQERVGAARRSPRRSARRLAVTPETSLRTSARALDLQTVRPIIPEALRLPAVCARYDSISLRCGHRRHRPSDAQTWLIFSQAVTVAVAVLFVVATLKPEWLQRAPGVAALPPASSISRRRRRRCGSVAPRRAPATATARPPSAPRRRSSASPRARRRARSPHADDPWFRFFFGDRGAPAAGARRSASARA